MGGNIIKNACVTRLIKDKDNKLTGVVYIKNGKEVMIEGDHIISSMPVKDLVAGMNDVPEEMRNIAVGLPYRDYMTVGVLIPHLDLVNKTNYIFTSWITFKI